VVVWFSAHAALHDPAGSPTGAYDTMAARALVDSSVPRPAEHGVSADRLILAGVRAIHPAEQEVIDRLQITVIAADELTPASLVDAVAARAASGVVVHVDLDVLDPSALSGLSDPEPFGPDPAALMACIAAVRETVPLCGSAITEFSPHSPAAAMDDLGVILRLVGALA
jgi:arginase